jgi:hypothetical protein
MLIISTSTYVLSFFLNIIPMPFIMFKMCYKMGLYILKYVCLNAPHVQAG